MQGRSGACLWMTTGRRGADPHGPGSSFHCWDPEYIVSQGRVSEPQFNKPFTALAAIPRKLINAVRCHGCVCFRRRGRVAAFALHQGCNSSSVHQPRPYLHTDLLEMLPPSEDQRRHGCEAPVMFLMLQKRQLAREGFFAYRQITWFC